MPDVLRRVSVEVPTLMVLHTVDGLNLCGTGIKPDRMLTVNLFACFFSLF